jgi:hypothetical protein
MRTILSWAHAHMFNTHAVVCERDSVYFTPSGVRLGLFVCCVCYGFLNGRASERCVYVAAAASGRDKS